MSELYDILTETPPTKVVLLALDQGLWDCERSLAELAACARPTIWKPWRRSARSARPRRPASCWAAVSWRKPALAAQELGAECAVFDGELTGSQIRNISTALGGLESSTAPC